MCFQSRRKSRACHLLQKEVRWSQRDVREKHLTRAFRYYLSMHTAVYILCFFNLICPHVVVYIVPWNCALHGSRGAGFRWSKYSVCICVCVCVCVWEREREREGGERERLLPVTSVRIFFPCNYITAIVYRTSPMSFTTYCVSSGWWHHESYLAMILNLIA